MVCISQRGLSQATCFRLCVKLKRDRCHTTYRCDPPGSREMACDRPRDATNTEVGTDHERAGCCPMPCRVLAASRFDVERLESDFKHAEPRTHSSCCQSSSAFWRDVDTEDRLSPLCGLDDPTPTLPCKPPVPTPGSADAGAAAASAAAASASYALKAVLPIRPGKFTFVARSRGANLAAYSMSCTSRFRLFMSSTRAFLRSRSAWRACRTSSACCRRWD